VCPRDRGALSIDGETLTCAEGHAYPYVDGIPVLVVDELEPTQPGYWAKPEQIEAVRTGEPAAVTGDEVDPYVAELILGTHGNLYKHLSTGLTRYPIPDFPLPPGSGELLLDVGCNWGRWSISAARAGYRAVGIDPSFEAVVAARRIARQLGVQARYVVADARRLPFADATFDVVFSYGVLQHFAKRDVASAVAEIARAVKPDGYSWVQMPNALGVRNLYQLARRGFREGDRFEVRYWRPGELRRAFGAIGPTTLSTDGFFTLNPQKRDLDLLPRRYRALVRTSEALRRVSERVGLLTVVADSVNVRSRHA
jgi:2-polyprenyl-3-methyl-5-hydroxy-6-metoxy-1,4-benzoquinol methylase